MAQVWYGSSLVWLKFGMAQVWYGSSLVWLKFGMAQVWYGSSLVWLKFGMSQSLASLWSFQVGNSSGLFWFILRVLGATSGSRILRKDLSQPKLSKSLSGILLSLSNNYPLTYSGKNMGAKPRSVCSSSGVICHLLPPSTLFWHHRNPPRLRTWSWCRHLWWCAPGKMTPQVNQKMALNLWWKVAGFLYHVSPTSEAKSGQDLKKVCLKSFNFAKLPKMTKQTLTSNLINLCSEMWHPKKHEEIHRFLELKVAAALDLPSSKGLPPGPPAPPGPKGLGGTTRFRSGVMIWLICIEKDTKRNIYDWIMSVVIIGKSTTKWYKIQMESFEMQMKW